MKKRLVGVVLAIERAAAERSLPLHLRIATLRVSLGLSGMQRSRGKIAAIRRVWIVARLLRCTVARMVSVEPISMRTRGSTPAEIVKWAKVIKRAGVEQE